MKNEIIEGEEGNKKMKVGNQPNRSPQASKSGVF